VLLVNIHFSSLSGYQTQIFSNQIVAMLHFLSFDVIVEKWREFEIEVRCMKKRKAKVVVDLGCL
jgi:hypothetical protein